MHITFICYWGMLSLVNGVFDLVKLIDYEVKSPFPMFSADAPFMYNFSSVLQLAIPLSAIAAAVLAYYLYQDATSAPSEMGYSFQAPAGRNERSESRSILGGGASRQPQFKTF